MSTRAPAKRGGERNGAKPDAKPTAVLTAPDALGDRARTGIVADMFLTLQTQRFTLEAEVIANDLGDDSPVPNPQLHGAGKTVAERRKQIDEAETRLVERYADLLPEVEMLIKEKNSG